ncbi:hypothetical protein C0J52_01839 [Blattella germanica]|nr:hypothetical protein C0J52_01839 [Blattella germanica]
MRFVSRIGTVNQIGFLLFYLSCVPVMGSISRFEEEANVFSNALLNMLGSSKQYDVSPLCRTHIEDYLQALTNYTPWAVKIFSSSSNFLKVITDGDTQEMGNYDQCVGVKVKNNVTDFNGQLCRVSFQLKEQFNLKNDVEEFLEGIVKTTNSEPERRFIFSLCNPSTCSVSDVQTLVTRMFHEMDIGLNLSVSTIVCSHPKVTEFTTADIAIIIQLVAEVYILIYTRAYARAGPYLIGIALGYLLHRTKNKAIIIPKTCVLIGWLMSATICLTVLLGVSIFYDDLHEYNVIESGIYAGLHRPVWALGVAWVIFACVSGYGGPVDTILSWKTFIPLSRLTYCIYLCHYVILLYKIGSTRTNSYLSIFYTMHDFAGNILLSSILAALTSLAFEMPFINIIKIPYRKTDGKYKNMNLPESTVINNLEDSENPPEGHNNMAHERIEDCIP